VTTDRAPVYPRVIDEPVPGARHVLDQHANKRRGSRSWPAECTVASDARSEDGPVATCHRARHAFVPNLRQGRYEFTVDLPVHDRPCVAFAKLALSL
jgi:hypothetical protein